MRYQGKIGIVLLLGLASLPTAASDTFRFGVLPSLSAYNVTDPDGPTATNSAASLLSAVMFVEHGRDGRIMFQVVQDKFSLNASTTDIGQDVTSLEFLAAYQWQFRVTRGWKPWIGIGAGYANESFENRYTMTAGGFLGNTYPNRNLNDYKLILNTSTEWPVGKDWDMGIHLQFEEPISSDGIRTIRLGFYVVY
jgi:hypothetical protein